MLLSIATLPPRADLPHQEMSRGYRVQSLGFSVYKLGGKGLFVCKGVYYCRKSLFCYRV